MAENQDQDRTEEATPFKLRKAREKGTVARGMDLGFLSVLIALTAFVSMSGVMHINAMAAQMRAALALNIDSTSRPEQVLAIASERLWPVFYPVLLLMGVAVTIIIFLEMLQLRGFVFSGHPLKPDFSKLNPAKGLKRLFSLRMLKETLKNIIKMAAYAGCAYLFIRYSVNNHGAAAIDAKALAQIILQSGVRLLLLFMALAFVFVILDQIIVRKEFGKQMRMSNREVKREVKDREGDARQKQKRKQLHKEFVQQSESLRNVAGSDVIITNPHHYAVALKYDTQTMDAPKLTAKGRNNFALAIKRQAFRHGILTIENRKLARALYMRGRLGSEIGDDLYAQVAEIYMRIYRRKAEHPPLRAAAEFSDAT